MSFSRNGDIFASLVSLFSIAGPATVLIFLAGILAKPHRHRFTCPFTLVLFNGLGRPCRGSVHRKADAAKEVATMYLREGLHTKREFPWQAGRRWFLIATANDYCPFCAHTSHESYVAAA